MPGTCSPERVGNWLHEGSKEKKISKSTTRAAPTMRQKADEYCNRASRALLRAEIAACHLNKPPE